MRKGRGTRGKEIGEGKGRETERLSEEASLASGCVFAGG
jgi:hypothetical protein